MFGKFPTIEPLKPVEAPRQWTLPAAPVSATLDWQHDKALKKFFGIALAKVETPFQAACAVFEDGGKALWASVNWINDPVALEAKKEYQGENPVKLLDKDDFAAKVFQLADEKYLSGSYVLEGKDRIAALKLYAEIQGWIGKTAIDLSTNNFTNNEMKITLVKPEEVKKPQVIEHSDILSEDDNISPIKIKLVSAAR